MEEISLREYIEVILKGKKLIALITAICMILGLVVGFIQPKKYEANAILLTNPMNQNANTSTTSLSGIINSISQYPEMDITTYQEQFLNSDVVTKTIQELNLTNKDGSYISPRTLRGKVNLENPDKTNLLNVTVTDKDSELAAKMANTLCKYFSAFISELSREQGLVSAKAIEEQMKIEKENLDREAQKLRDYLSESTSIEVLKSQIDALVAQIASYNTQLNNIQTAIETDKVALENLRKTGLTSSSITSDISVNIPQTGGSSTFQFNIDSSNRLQGSLLTIEITNTETRLNSSLAQEQSILVKIDEMQKNLSELQSNLAEEQYKYNAIQRDYELAEQTYNTYQEKYKEANITAASDIGRVTIQISSPAVPPEEPTNISKVLILAISAILGFMLAIFIVFFKEYWNTSRADSKK